MREYELTVIFTPVLKDDGLEKATKAVESLVKKLKGSVKVKNDEGKQNLTYPIAGFSEGIYVYFEFEMPAENAVEFESKLKLQKGLIRQLLVRKN